jgi:hypothetical protein
MHAKRFLRVGVFFSDAELQQLRTEAAAAGVTVAALIRDRALAGCPCRAARAA